MPSGTNFRWQMNRGRMRVLSNRRGGFTTRKHANQGLAGRESGGHENKGLRRARQGLKRDRTGARFRCEMRLGRMRVPNPNFLTLGKNP